jgi:rfaE bifunctional protein kinase chain/domain
MLRVDEEQISELDEYEYEELVDRIHNIFEKYDIDVVVFQDYDKGVISQDLINYVVELSLEENIPVVVDPKKKNFLSYKHVTLFKPNLKEVKEGLNIDFSEEDRDQLEEAVEKLKKELDTEMVLNTLSDKGVFIKTDDVSELITAHYRNIADVSGAGDTVISVAALCLALGIDAVDMAAVANLAGGLVCEEVGVVPIDKYKLQDEVNRLLAK